MKKLLPILIALIALSATTTFSACKKEKNNVTPQNTTGTTGTNSVLTAFEQQSITYTREEEKMARDVYTVLLGKWSQYSFLSNIIGSEQKHMDALKNLVDKYNLTDPVTDNTTGVFTNSEIKKLYADLVAKGELSEKDALIVGMTIEDMDIYDLQQALAQVTQEDIKTVYGNLKNASGNHMREFYTQLTNIGGTYTPQYITQAEFEAIVTTPKQHGGGHK